VWKLNGYYTMIIVLASISLSLALVTLISVFWKISAHSVGISGIAGFLFGFYYKYADQQLFYPILAIILIAGLLMSARLALNAHNPMQIFVGALLGWSISFGAIYVFL
jgi:membrane-associated phospholipid phosphatase